MEKATFGAGCFWHVESFFRQVPGVTDAICGYAGGHLSNPTYEDICSDQTAHAEVVEVTFDPAKVSYGQLVDAFFANHNPTTVNRQGPDVGTQYRSVIFTHSPEQERIAREKKAALAKSGKLDRPVVTTIEPVPTFWKAEEYHQRYFEKNKMASCASFPE
jgi:peptide-methionine (S)-S-oxide reductase